MDKPTVPFTIRALPIPEASKDADKTSKDADKTLGYASLLPASYRTKSDEIKAPELRRDFITQELSVKRLNDIQDWLWVCGRPMPPRPLHHQILISRSIAITENPELHLVWSKNRIFLKPIPSWLLEPGVWDVLVALDASSTPSDPETSLVACARGFLFSYTALVAYESDFHLAREHRLLPAGVAWEDWKALAGQALAAHAYGAYNARYWYGELRLSRLNKIYRARKGFVFRGYSSVAAHAVYADLIRDNFAALATVLGYVVIVLTAMQVGLGTERLQADGAFQSVSYGFTVFSIIAPLIAAAGIMLVVLGMFVSNWLATKSYEGRRFARMGVEPFWRNQPAKSTATASSSAQGTLASSESRGTV